MAENFETTKFHFIANNLSIDFVNTLIVDKGEPLDLIASTNDLLGWAIAAGLLDEENARRLFANQGDEKEQRNTLIQAKKFRRSLYETVRSIAEKGEVILSTVTEINKLLRKKGGYEEMIKAEGGFEKYYHQNLNSISNLLVPIAESASEFLCNGDLKLVKKCESSECVLYFYDTNKDHKRRWCKMSACGNRAKAAKFYKKKAA